ncbi:DUF3817 domain-containing protein [Zavarzinella formosa]|uniref:DUF3817 domain-containing protein n=1 Tax=Zavarzinella formosa TaxID=360055 RepID=UPI00031B715B|nr:DUF3817 domain-containing protein [Zavarzinella formosa]
MSKSLRIMRLVGYCEGASFLLLLGVAMPLKYAAGQPLGVEIVGPIHGGLWILYLLAAVIALKSLRGGFLKMALAFVASILPFGPFVFDAWVIRQETPAPVSEGTGPSA